MGAVIRSLMGVPLALGVTGGLFLTLGGLTRASVLPLPDERVGISLSAMAPVGPPDMFERQAYEKPEYQKPYLTPPPAISSSHFEDWHQSVNVRHVAPSRPSDDLSDAIAAAFSWEHDPIPCLFRFRPPRRNQGYEHCIKSEEPREETVRVQFNVDPEGNVYDVRAVESTNTCYTPVAIRAAERWKYQPKVVDGNAVPRIGVQTSIRF